MPNHPAAPVETVPQIPSGRHDYFALRDWKMRYNPNDYTLHTSKHEGFAGLVGEVSDKYCVECEHRIDAPHRTGCPVGRKEASMVTVPSDNIEPASKIPSTTNSEKISSPLVVPSPTGGDTELPEWVRRNVADARGIRNYLSQQGSGMYDPRSQSGALIYLADQVEALEKESAERLRRYLAADEMLRLNREQCHTLIWEKEKLEQQAAQAAADSKRYQFLTQHTCNSLHVERDEHHSSYQTARDYIEDRDMFSDCSAERVWQMGETDTIWRLQVYPSTPIGFIVFFASTLNDVIDDAIAAISQAQGEG